MFCVFIRGSDSNARVRRKTWRSNQVLARRVLERSWNWRIQKQLETSRLAFALRFFFSHSKPYIEINIKMIEFNWWNQICFKNLNGSGAVEFSVNSNYLRISKFCSTSRTDFWVESFQTFRTSSMAAVWNTFCMLVIVEFCRTHTTIWSVFVTCF